jgi:hypothetical protein
MSTLWRGIFSLSHLARILHTIICSSDCPNLLPETQRIRQCVRDWKFLFDTQGTALLLRLLTEMASCFGTQILGLHIRMHW